MNLRSSLALSLALVLLPTPAYGQQRTKTPAQQQQQQQQQRPPADDDDVVRITTNLIQVDAVVLDGDGRHVSTLGPEDFEILQDGRKQPITNFSYIRVASKGSNVAASATPAEAPRTKEARREKKVPAPPVPPAVTRPEQARRIVVLAMDDLGLSFESVVLMQRALRKFVDEQLQPGDLAAVVRTGTGAGALQQLTSDKRQLHAAINSLRWNPRGRASINPIVQAAGQGGDPDRAGIGDSGMNDRAGGVGDGRDTIGGLRERISTNATLEALAYFVRGLRELPGRKSIVIFSDSIPTHDYTGQSFVDTDMRRLIDLANRSSVTFYGIDPRGLPTLNIEAADTGIYIGSVPGAPASAPRLSQVQSGNDPRLGPRRSAFFRSQDGIVHITRQTGGFAVINSNDIRRGLERALDDQSGYYLIGYRPDEKTFDPETGARKFRSLDIKVKRPGLKVRTRSGFYGTPEREEREPAPRTSNQMLVDALASPFDSGGVGLRLTSLFANEPQEGSFLRSLLHIDTRGLTFTDDADGWKKAVIDVLAVVFHADGTIAGQTNRTHTLRARGDALEHVQKTGIVYTLNVPVKGAGAYQLRFAVRDVESDRIGSASEFVEVPDVARERLALSGLVAVGVPAAAANSSAQASQPAGAAATVELEPDPQIGPAVRRFRRGMRMDFGYVIYNARLDRATGKPSLTTQVRMFRDGKQVFSSEPEPFDAGTQPDLKRLVASGRLRLGGELTPGQYVLQVVVIDQLAPERERLVTQWTDFEIVQ